MDHHCHVLRTSTTLLDVDLRGASERLCYGWLAATLFRALRIMINIGISELFSSSRPRRTAAIALAA